MKKEIGRIRMASTTMTRVTIISMGMSKGTTTTMVNIMMMSKVTMKISSMMMGATPRRITPRKKQKERTKVLNPTLTFKRHGRKM